VDYAEIKRDAYYLLNSTQGYMRRYDVENKFDVKIRNLWYELGGFLDHDTNEMLHGDVRILQERKVV